MRLPEQIIGDIKAIREQRDALTQKEKALLNELMEVRASIDDFLK